MSTRILSWQQIVTESDPDWSYENQRPWIYRFSNGRRFRRPTDFYSNYALVSMYMTDDFGNVMTDEFGNPMSALEGPNQGSVDFTSDFTSDFA